MVLDSLSPLKNIPCLHGMFFVVTPFMCVCGTWGIIGNSPQLVPDIL